MQNILNIQPVIPIAVDKDWNIITRTIVLLIWMPTLSTEIGAKSGIGDIQISAILSPASPGDWIWGVGAIAQLPTNSSEELGNKNWGLGPTAVVLHLEHGDPWVYGVLVNNIWSLTSSQQGGSYNNGLVQPFVNYNSPEDFHLTSAPIWTVNWKANSRHPSTRSINASLGKPHRPLPASAYSTRSHPPAGSAWSGARSRRGPPWACARRCSRCRSWAGGRVRRWCGVTRTLPPIIWRPTRNAFAQCVPSWQKATAQMAQR